MFIIAVVYTTNSTKIMIQVMLVYLEGFTQVLLMRIAGWRKVGMNDTLFGKEHTSLYLWIV